MKRFFAFGLLLAAVGALGCQRISAREVLPEYVKKKEEAKAAAKAQPEAPEANPPTFFPGQKID